MWGRAPAASAGRDPYRPGRRYGDGVEEIDRTIVSLLSGDGRMSFTELAKRTGLSVSAAHRAPPAGAERGDQGVRGTVQTPMRSVSR